MMGRTTLPQALPVDIFPRPSQAMLGVGGIGSGAFFLLNGAHTLGREESRSGHFIDRRDYCKLHIISHYVKVLLGENINLLPIGKVGDDEAGQRLIKEMGMVGLNLRHIQTVPGMQTLYSFCFLYPDGSGGNLTTDNSACDLVGEEDVYQAESDFLAYQSHGIALAAPEVSLVARQKLLQMGTKYHFWRVAAFTSAEIEPAIEMGLLLEVDLLALNRDEAAAVARMRSSAGDEPPQPIVEAALARLKAINSALHVTVTAGGWGSWSWDGKEMQHLPAFPAELVSTAGAGDAFLAGVIAGRVAGLNLQEAQELGMLVAAHSVTSPHTIDPKIDLKSLSAFASKASLVLSLQVGQFLAGKLPISF
jgi:sugar/nucleoside kinase (ribokinase family)